MKMKLFLTIALIGTLGIVLCCSLVNAQEHKQAETKKAESPQSKLMQFQMALLKRGPKWSPEPSRERAEMRQRHLAHLRSMLEANKLIIAGAISDDNELIEVHIFRTKSAEEATAWLNEDPAVAAGFIVPELHPWWSEDVMKKPTMPLKLTTAYLAFLTRGNKWTAEKTPATEAIQKAHLENINKLAEMKKLVVAGPFGDNGRLRGIFVFKVDSIDEARSLAATDPAVQAGRLALQIHPWTVPEGILP
jgi:uncharacterized protein YciI